MKFNTIIHVSREEILALVKLGLSASSGQTIAFLYCLAYIVLFEKICAILFVAYAVYCKFIKLFPKANPCAFYSFFRPEHYPKERLPETMVLLDNLGLLAEILNGYLKLHQVEVLCHLVECLVTAMVLQIKGIDVEDESSNEVDLDNLPKQMSTVFKKLDGSVAGFVEKKLFQSLEHSTDEQWHMELQVIMSVARTVSRERPKRNVTMTKFPLLKDVLACQRLRI